MVYESIKRISVQMRAYKTEIYPTKEQIKLIHQTCGNVRYIYNQYIATNFERLDKNEPILALKDVERIKKDGIFYYTYGKYQSLEEAIKSQQELDQKGIKNAVIEKKYR